VSDRTPISEVVLTNRATSPSYRKNDESDSTIIFEVKKPKCLGAQSEAECRKIISDFNLLIVNRRQDHQNKVFSDAEKRLEFNTVSPMQKKPFVSNTSQKLAKKRQPSPFSIKNQFDDGIDEPSEDLQDTH